MAAVTNDQKLSGFSEGPREVRFIEIESRTVGARAGLRGMGSYCLMGTVSVLQDEKKCEDVWW